MPRQLQELVNQQILKSNMAGRTAVKAGLPTVKPVVTISRTMGSGARIIAEKLSKDLGWSLWDKELIDAIADDAHVSHRLVEELDERSTSEIQLLMREMLGDEGAGGFMYKRHLVKVVASISELGHAIILGRGANFVLSDALNVRIDAPEALRVQNMMKFEGLGEREAREKIRKSDKDREAFIERVFGGKTVGHCQYNLSVCMCTFSIEDAVDLIKRAIRAKFGLPSVT
ncbi:MAG: cytidylate kinase-like family protein [Armatimonadota bacterium]